MSYKEKKEDRFTRIYKENGTSVERILYSGTGNPHCAEDLAQEIFTALYTSLDRVDNVRAWIHATIRHFLCDHYAEVAHWPLRLENWEYVSDNSVCYTDCPLETRIMIDQAIESITDPVDLELFMLVSFQSHTYFEAGSRLGLTSRQARYRYGLIKARLRHYFDVCGIRDINELIE